MKKANFLDRFAGRYFVHTTTFVCAFIFMEFLANLVGYYNSLVNLHGMLLLVLIIRWLRVFDNAAIYIDLISKNSAILKILATVFIGMTVLSLARFYSVDFYELVVNKVGIIAIVFIPIAALWELVGSLRTPNE